MKGVISRAVVAAALMTTFSAQALVSNTTKLANANSGVVAAQVNWFDFTGFNRTEAISRLLKYSPASEPVQRL